MQIRTNNQEIEALSSNGIPRNKSFISVGLGGGDSGIFERNLNFCRFVIDELVQLDNRQPKIRLIANSFYRNVSNPFIVIKIFLSFKQIVLT